LATLSPVTISGELTMKVWRSFHEINFNPYKMSDIFYTTVLPMLNGNEIEVTD
jgi:hypothetical protein